MDKIWMVQFGGYSGRKYYKTEAAFMEAINKHHTKATVTIFEEVESHNAIEYKNNLITQREREDQLQILLEDNQEISVLHQIKEIINSLDNDKNYTIRGILRKFSSRGMNAKTFKNMLDRDVRKFMLYTGPSTKEWYKLLLQIHNFKMEDKYQIGYDYRSGAKFKDVEKERLDNFKLAKEELKKEKKNGKKENTSV